MYMVSQFPLRKKWKGNGTSIFWQQHHLSFLKSCTQKYTHKVKSTSANLSLQKLSVPLPRFTYICVLNEKMFAGSIPLHREHITLFLLTLPHQEVSITLQQLLDLQSGNSSVVPVLLPQRTIHILHWGGNWNLLEAGTEKSEIFKADMYDETIRSDKGQILR